MTSFQILTRLYGRRGGRTLALSREDKLTAVADLQANPAWRTYLLHWQLEREAHQEQAMEALRAGELHKATLSQGRYDEDDKIIHWTDDLIGNLVDGVGVVWEGE